MKTSIKIASLFFGVYIMMLGCQDVTIGYLMVDNSSYDPDTLVVKTVLDGRAPEIVPNPVYEQLRAMGIPHEVLVNTGVYPTMQSGGGEDYNRAKWGQPWVSTPIQGVMGTQPIAVTITRVKTTGGNVDKLLKYITVRGDGVFEIPLEHDVPAGRYLVSLNFRNEGYSKDVEDCFTVIVE